MMTMLFMSRARLSVTALALAALLASCNSQPTVDNATNVASSLRGDEPATSASAEAARTVVTQYFTLIEQGKYAEARMLWGNDGADSGGDVQALKKAFDIYAQYRATVGDPTEIKARDGNQYIAVQATARVKMKQSGESAELSGAVLLKRSANAAEPVPSKREWRIWGVDVRRRK